MNGQREDAFGLGFTPGKASLGVAQGLGWALNEARRDDEAAKEQQAAAAAVVAAATDNACFFFFIELKESL